MAHPRLESLLFRIRDGLATVEEVQLARDWVRTDPRLPEELRSIADFVDDPEGDAAGLLAVLGADPLFGDVLREGIAAELEEASITAADVDEPWSWSRPLAAAIRAESGEVELAGPVLEALGSPSLPVGEAIRAESGEVELAGPVLEALGSPSLPVGEAIRAESGEVALWDALEPMLEGMWVSAMLDHALDEEAQRMAIRRLHGDPVARAQMTAFANLGARIRAAIEGEAGPCPYIWGAVAERIGVDAEEVAGWDGALFAAAVCAEAGTVDLVDAVGARVERPSMPGAVVELDGLPVPANRRFSLVTVAMMAAVALFLLGMPQLFRTANVGSPVAQTIAITDQFAAADEIVIESLDYGDDANVYQATGDQGALILWVDEGKTL